MGRFWILDRGGPAVLWAGVIGCVLGAGAWLATCEAREPAAIGAWVVKSTPSATGSLAPNPRGRGKRTPSVAPPVPAQQTGTKGERSSGTAKQMTAPKLVPVAYAELTGWADDDHLAAMRAFRASCPQVVAGKAGRARGPDVDAFLAACRAALASEKLTKATARTFFEHHFEPHRIIHKGTDGLLTGYYEPVMEGSRTPQGRFQTPIFKRPADLVTIVPETRGAAPGSVTHARRTAAGLVPFATRAEIDRGALAGQNLEILYLTDPVEKFFLQIQGSGVVRLTDGSSVRSPVRRQERASVHLNRTLLDRQGPPRGGQDVDGGARPMAEVRYRTRPRDHEPERLLRVFPRDAARTQAAPSVQSKCRLSPAAPWPSIPACINSAARSTSAHQLSRPAATSGPSIDLWSLMMSVAPSRGRNGATFTSARARPPRGKPVPCATQGTFSLWSHGTRLPRPRPDRAKAIKRPPAAAPDDKLGPRAPAEAGRTAAAHARGHVALAAHCGIDRCASSRQAARSGRRGPAGRSTGNALDTADTADPSSN